MYEVKEWSRFVVYGKLFLVVGLIDKRKEDKLAMLIIPWKNVPLLNDQVVFRS
ncbi:hypothetical protein [Cytobacillus praedii]|uniref:hypothetical protein n=1 Tax=Cytobacillus praedii TaxID=1742358 RepID=UPI002E1FCE4D|nr:hypothetical protein [Cytobacillus praedii]